MDDYTKYIILSHLHWIEKGLTADDISKAYTEIKDKDIFSGVKMHQIQENIGYKVNNKEIITSPDYEKIKFLWLSLSSSKIDLSFVKFCTNLEAINIGCFSEENLDALQENIKLRKIIANSNKLTHIDALYAHSDLEYINIEDNPCVCLKPIAHLRKISELRVGLIAEEKYAFQILRNNTMCKMTYIIDGGDTGFENLSIPYYQFVITKDEQQLEICIEGVNDTSPWPIETPIPRELLENEDVYEKILDRAYCDLSYRLEQILGEPTTIDYQNSYTFGNSYHLNYTHSLQPKN